MTAAASVRPRYAIVEDEPFMAKLVGDMLMTEDADVEVFAFGSQLLKSPNLLHFKAIILDLSLPDVDGFDLMDQLASKNAGITVQLMSGHDQVVVNAAHMYGKGIGLTMRGALVKPFSRQELFASLGLQP